MAKYSAIPAFERAGMSRVETAEYIGVSPTKLDQMVEDRRMPQPRQVDGRKVWSRKEVDQYFENLPYAKPPAEDADETVDANPYADAQA
jgi:predicted DNA-binding transcriptional regulator AlpA